jgi:alpha-glucosidase (family GH31 glycosyl hydrolase)
VTENQQELHLTYDQCCGLYVRAGSVLPIKLHNGALSLERALTLPIRLEVYLDPVSQRASGNLYLDDGDTFDFLQGERALSYFWYEPTTNTLMMNQTLGWL